MKLHRPTRTRPGCVLSALGGLLCAALVALMPAAARAQASAPSADKARPAAAAGAVREIQWDALMPAGWDPFKGLRDKHKGVGMATLTDTDPRAQALLTEMRELLDNAPTVAALDGARVRLAGYVVPLDVVKGELRDFLLVPYFGACIHTPPPPSNQVIRVLPTRPVTGIQGMVPVWVSGTLKILREDSDLGVSGYRLDAQSVQLYEARPK